MSPSSSSQTQIFLNNTLAGNTAADSSSGILVTGFGQNASFTNNIVIASTGQAAVTCNSTFSPTSAVFSYNDAFSSSGPNWSGICDTTSQPGNISADPQFFSAASDLHIPWGSPAVDAGGNSAPNLPSTDFDGNPRVVDGNGDGVAVVDIGAYEVLPTTISLAPSNLTFGAQPLGSSSATQTVTLTNTGNQKLTLVISVDANFAQTNNCGSALPAGASCSINVSFSPMTHGTITGNVTLVDTASGSPQEVALVGAGGGAAASLSPASLDFGSQAVGSTSAAQAITLSNTGDDVMGITGIASSGDFAETNTCGSTLAAGANCSISATLSPTAVGARSGSVTVTDNASGSPQAVSLTGTGIGPIAALAPASLAFGSQLVGTTSPAQSVLLSNTGNAPLVISGITATGDFTETNACGTALAAGASCSIAVSFSPKARELAVGTLSVTDNANGNPQTAGLTGTGVAPVVNLSPVALAFGNQPLLSTSAAQIVTLTNSGDATLLLNSIGTTGDFGQTSNCNGFLAPAASCMVSVTFAPSAPGSRAGSLIFNDNAPAGNQQTVGLSGTGSDFSLSASPANPSVVRGSSVNVTVSLNSLGGPFGNSVSLSCSRLPSGAACAFSPASVVPGNSGSTSVMTVTTNHSVAALGTFVVTISGQSGALAHSTEIHLTVTKH